MCLVVHGQASPWGSGDGGLHALFYPDLLSVHFISDHETLDSVCLSCFLSGVGVEAREWTMSVILC